MDTPFHRKLAPNSKPITTSPLQKFGREVWTFNAPKTRRDIQHSSYFTRNSQRNYENNDLNFCDRPNLLVATVLSYNAKDIAFSPYGEYWRQLRKICTIELLNPKRVQSFRSIREAEVSELVKTISAAASEGSVVNLSHKIFSMTYGITARVVFGEKNRHQEVFKSTFEEALNVLGGFCIADLYPSIKVLQWMSSAKAKMEKTT
ncbi:Cytochrome P450 [Sesbania bispinosa]|nr:Cytochrome P450 [Sesbania bispinosa]